jgi:hypothetical protein
VSVMLSAGGRKVMDTTWLDSKHYRSICDEIGERLRQQIDRTTTSMPQKILDLLQQLEQQEFEAPSLVPSLAEMEPLKIGDPIA